MAEGHAVIRWARRLRPLAGAPLRTVTMPKRWGDRPATLVGQHLTDVRTRGKHLLLPLSGGETLHTHAMQYGSWQVGPPGMLYRKDPKYVRLRLATDAHEAVFYHGPVVELLTAEELAAHPKLNALGPDVMAPDFDRAEAFRRVQAAGTEPVGPVVLNQRVVAGLGNIYKSEGLFLARIDPRRPAASVSRAELERLWDAVIPLMWEGTERYGKTRTTTPALQEEGHLNWVYRRKNKPCLVCGTPIALVRLPPFERSTYLCPVCQR